MITAKNARKNTEIYHKLEKTIGERLELLYQKIKINKMIKKASANGESDVLVSDNIKPATIQYLKDNEYDVKKIVIGYRISW